MEWIRHRFGAVPPRLWRALAATVKAYVALLLAIFVLGLCFYFADGRDWEAQSNQEAKDMRWDSLTNTWAKEGEDEGHENDPDQHMLVKGSAFDESLWLAFCVAHSMSFGEFTPRVGLWCASPRSSGTGRRSVFSPSCSWRTCRATRTGSAQPLPSSRRWCAARGPPSLFCSCSSS